MGGAWPPYVWPQVYSDAGLGFFIMPVSSQFLKLADGLWTPICQQRDTRKSLLCCALGADVILAPTTNSVPAVVTAGACQAGVYLSGGSNGYDPTIFRLSLAIDDDLVRQQWYAQPVTVGGAGGVVTQLAFGTGGNFAAPNLNINFAYLPSGSAIIIVCYDVMIAANPVTLTSALLGELTPIQAAQTPAVGGNVGDVQIFVIPNAGGPDTINISAAARGNAVCWVYGLGGGGIADANGTHTGASNPITVTASTPGSVAQEIAFFAALADSTLTQSTVTAVGWTGLGGYSVTDNHGHSWQGLAAFLPLATVTTATISTNNVAALVGWGAVIVTVPWLASVTGTEISVFEAFDLAEQLDEGGSITVGLPKLSRGGLLALNDLIDKFGQKGNPDVETTDAVNG